MLFGPASLRVGPLCIGPAPLGDMPEAYGTSVPEVQAVATPRAAFAGSKSRGGALDALQTCSGRA